MKLVIAIVQDYDCDQLLHAVSGAGLGATRIASTGGFLRTGNTTVIMGVRDDRVTVCLDLIRGACQARVERPPEELLPDFADWGSAGVAEVIIGGAVVFVMNVGRFVRIERSEAHEDAKASTDRSTS